jgi:hypothetical protein
MSARFDQLASDLKAIRALLGIEGERHAGKLAAIRGERERRFIQRRLRAASRTFADKLRLWTWPQLVRTIGLGRLPYAPQLGPEKRLAARKWTKEVRILTGIVFTAFGAFSLSAVIFVQFNALKVDVVSLKRDLAITAEKLAKLEANVTVARPDPNDIKNSADSQMLGRAAGMPRASFTLTPDELTLIRAIIKVPPPLPGVVQSINVGDLLPNTGLAPLPEPITKKAPKLLGARFTVDRNGTIVVVAPGTNRAEVLINPK